MELLFISETTQVFTVVVSISKAQLCVNNYCENVLVGKDTPIGVFPLTYAETDEKGYQGNVLVFKKEQLKTYAVHRVWNEIPAQKRYTRLASSNVYDRIISAGCINVSNTLYEKLLSLQSINIEIKL